MSLGIRSAILKEIADSLKCSSQSLPTGALRKSKTDNAPQLCLSLADSAALEDVAKLRFDDRFVKKVAIVGNGRSKENEVVFDLRQEAFVTDALGADPLAVAKRSGKVVVEYSSPNIAKPFHVGHLRSTIIGNFIANLHKQLHYDVVRLNYLGDWGTQFGMLQLGIEMSGLSEEEIRTNPIRSLLNAYVAANIAAKSDETVLERAKQHFHEMETNSASPILKRWEQLRGYTVDELAGIYNRLGIAFDRYDWESQYSQKQIQSTLQLLDRHSLLKDEVDGRKIVEVGDRRVPIVKSDNTSLYLARDVAALLDRFERYSFSKMYYVVDNAQTDHFNAVFTVCKQVESAIEGRVEHIKFGRIKGMSTRSGNVVFLKDVLDEARDVMLLKQKESLTTKQNLDPSVADTLGITAVMVNDFKQRRQRDYDFSWDKALQANGDSGIKLQYTHCRLCSLIEANDTEPAQVADSKLLAEPEAVNLIFEIARFSDVLDASHKSLEPCVIVNYLFGLSNAISRALKRLNIKHEESAEIRAQRMLLFVKAKSILKSGMQVLGLTPLERM